MERYTELTRHQKEQRRTKGESNHQYARYADAFVVLCNGTKAQAEAMKPELHTFRRTELHS